MARNDYRHRDDRAELWKYLKALLTTAEDKGDHYVVNGQNLSLTGICDGHSSGENK
jgi:hypothetical protein